MKNKITILKALVATLLLTAGFSRASAQVEQAVSPQHKIGTQGELLPCDGCIVPCIDGINLS
jgi:hypothetical protein